MPPLVNAFFRVGEALEALGFASVDYEAGVIYFGERFWEALYSSIPWLLMRLDAGFIVGAGDMEVFAVAAAHVTVERLRGLGVSKIREDDLSALVGVYLELYMVSDEPRRFVQALREALVGRVGKEADLPG